MPEQLAVARANAPTRSYSRGVLARGVATADEPLPVQQHQPVYRAPEFGVMCAVRRYLQSLPDGLILPPPLYFAQG